MFFWRLLLLKIEYIHLAYATMYTKFTVTCSWLVYFLLCHSITPVVKALHTLWDETFTQGIPSGLGPQQLGLLLL